MELPLTEHLVRLGPGDAGAYRVLRVADPGRAALVDEGTYLQLWADRTAAARLAAAWLLAARSRHSLVYLPYRAGPLTAARVHPDAEPGGGPDTLDLLLVHHSRQFPAARWKRLRSRLGPGRPHAARLPRDGFRPLREAIPDGSHHAEYRDRLREHTAAGAVLLTGSAPAFAAYAGELLELAGNTPAAVADAADRGSHLCCEVHPATGLLDKRARMLHVELHLDW